MLKCVDLIEIRFHTYFYASSFLVLWDHCEDTGSWIRGQIRIYEGKYGYLRGQITNNDLQLLLNMQKHIATKNVINRLLQYIYILLSIPLPKTFNFWFDYDPCSLWKFEFDNVFKKKLLLLQFILYFQFLHKHKNVDTRMFTSLWYLQVQLQINSTLKILDLSLRFTLSISSGNFT